MAEAGLSLSLIKNAGDWRSDTVCEGYIDSSSGSKRTIADAFNDVVTVKLSTVSDVTTSLTSSVSDEPKIEGATNVNWTNYYVRQCEWSNI